MMGANITSELNGQVWSVGIERPARQLGYDCSRSVHSCDGDHWRRAAMNEHVYKTIEITGSSHKGPEEAIRLAIEKASQSVHNLRWFKVVEMRGTIDNGKIDYWQATLDLGFTLE
jgi:flavin-binding protein dodecin